jgi:hypothetical protein
MKKIYILIAVLLTAFVLCSCGDADITCSITKNNEVEMKINLELDVSDLIDSEKSDIKQNISSLFKHINSTGYKFSKDYGSKNYEITLTKTAQGTSREDAVNKLLDMMGDDSSPFASVKGGYSSSNLSDVYHITATVDLTKIVDYDYISTLKQEQQDRISELMSTFTGTVTLDLYGNTTEFKGSLDGTKNTVELSLNEPVEIYSMVEIINEENQAEYDELKDEVAALDAEKNKYMMFVFLASGLLIAFAVAIIIIMIVRKGKSAKATISESKEAVMADAPLQSPEESEASSSTQIVNTEEEDTKQ